MIIDLLEGNQYKPIITTETTIRNQRDHINMDHDYCVNSKKKYEQEQSMPNEIETQNTKKIKIDCILQPLVTNFDCNFFLSHCETVQVPFTATENVEENASDTENTDQSPSLETTIDRTDYSKRQMISTWISDESYSDELDINEKQFIKTCSDFIDNLSITENEVNEIETLTRGQSENTAWFNYRCGRVTASKFGEIKNRRPTTAPDRLLREIFQYNKNKTAQLSQCKEGLRLEPIIRDKYIAKQIENGHDGIQVSEKGLIIDQTAPLLAASIDGEVFDPNAKHSSIGNMEIKYVQFPNKLNIEQKQNVNLLTFIASNIKNSCLELTNGNALKLKTRHHYYSQIQGAMGVTKRQWCDLIVYTYYGKEDDLFIERIYFDPIFWNELKAALLDFCLYGVVPEILTQRIRRGKQLNPTKYIYKK